MKTAPVVIRPVTENDAEELVKIYAPYVSDTAVSFEYVIPSVEEFTRRIRDTLRLYPYLAAVQDGCILGYAYAGVLKARQAYGRSVETTVYVRADHKRHGIGALLYTALENALRDMGILNMYACVAYPREEDEYLTRDSISFHERMGFTQVGRLNLCGQKFGRWYDLVYMEKFIGEHGALPSEKTD